MIGITSYIQQTLRGGCKFQPVRTIGDVNPIYGMSGPETGLRLGRETDRVLNGTKPLNPSDPWHKRADHILRYLRQRLKIQIVARQKFVTHESTQIKTHIDAIGKDANGKLYVIEYKTTQYSLEHHQQGYERCCKNRPKLCNQLPNNEKTAHALQAAFGALALGHANVQPLVIVAAEDGIAAYKVPLEYMQLSLFPTQVATSKSKSSSKIQVKFAKLTPQIEPYILRVIHPRKIVKTYHNNILWLKDDTMKSMAGIIQKPLASLSKPLQQRYINAIKATIGRKKNTRGYIIYHDPNAKDRFKMQLVARIRNK